MKYIFIGGYLETFYGIQSAYGVGLVRSNRPLLTAPTRPYCITTGNNNNIHKVRVCCLHHGTYESSYINVCFYGLSIDVSFAKKGYNKMGAIRSYVNNSNPCIPLQTFNAIFVYKGPTEFQQTYSNIHPHTPTVSHCRFTLSLLLHFKGVIAHTIKWDSNSIWGTQMINKIVKPYSFLHVLYLVIHHTSIKAPTGCIHA
jgi:hypothetical protein